MELVVAATLRLAIKDNAAALREVWDRVDGKVRQDIGVETNLHAEIKSKLMKHWCANVDCLRSATLQTVMEKQ
jgi:hypothetical protein